MIHNSEAPSKEIRPKGKTKNLVIGGLFLVLLLSLGGIVLPSVEPSAGRLSNQESLLSGPVTVRAGNLYYVRFVTDGPSRLAGRLQTTGGDGNDIQVVVASADEFQNWQNGHSARVLYQTDKITIANLNVQILASGTYYLGLNNKFSILSDKTVTGTIVLYK